MTSKQKGTMTSEWDQFSHLFKRQEIPAKTTLLQEGQISRTMFFIEKGCLRTWVNNDGKDITTQFFFEGDRVASIESFTTDQPNLYSIESLEPCVLQTMSRKAFVAHKPIDPQVIDYNKRLEKADHLIFIFPIWWDLTPAMTKGFIDRVLCPGVVYDHHPRGFGLVPLLKNLKGVTIITTMNKPKIMYSLLMGNLIRKAMLRSVFKTMGYKNRNWISFALVKSVSEERRKKWLTRLENKFSEFN